MNRCVVGVLLAPHAVTSLSGPVDTSDQAAMNDDTPTDALPDGQQPGIPSSGHPQPVGPPREDALPRSLRAAVSAAQSARTVSDLRRARRLLDADDNFLIV